MSAGKDSRRWRTREAFKLQTISLEHYVAEIDKEEARMEGMEKGKFEVARKTLARRMSMLRMSQNLPASGPAVLVRLA
jgi:hypothetical protein